MFVLTEAKYLREHRFYVQICSEARPVAGNMETPTPPIGRSGDETSTVGISPRVPPEDEVRRMFPDGMSHDFGKVPCGSVHECSFRIVNTSKYELKIEGVRVSTNISIAARASMDILKPGETGTIRIRQDSKYFINAKTSTVFVTYTVGGSFHEARFCVQCYSDKSMLPKNVTPLVPATPIPLPAPRPGTSRDPF